MDPSFSLRALTAHVEHPEAMRVYLECIVHDS